MPNPRISVSQLKRLIQLRANRVDVRARYRPRANSLSQGCGLEVRPCGPCLACQHVGGGAGGWTRSELERRVFAAGPAAPGAEHPRHRTCAWIHTEMKRHKHVTLQLLWEEYQSSHGPHGAALQRVLQAVSAVGEATAAFDARAALRRRETVLRLREPHRADLRRLPARRLSGPRCSSAPWARAAMRTRRRRARRRLPDWLGSHVRMLEFYGASPTILVPDNPRVGVTKADRYEPELQRSYEEMAGHFGIAVIPARPYRPKDKPKAELTVLLVCRWILARLRHQRFFSLGRTEYRDPPAARID